MGQPEIDGYLKNSIDCYIVGSGPSLKGFNFSTLQDKFTIAINHTIEHFPTANCLLFGDKIFLSKTSYDITKFPGLIFASRKAEHYPPLSSIVDRDNVYIFDDNRDDVSLHFDRGLFHPTTSGALAINLALVMKARKIYLLGFDYKYHKGQMHFYPDLDHHQRYAEDRTIRKVAKFEKFFPYRHKIFNCSPDSNLHMFDRYTLGAA